MIKKIIQKLLICGIVLLLFLLNDASGIYSNSTHKSNSMSSHNSISSSSFGTDWWPMYHHDLTHSGYSTSGGPNTNKILWTYTVGDYMYSSPAVVEGRVYFGSENSKMYCLNASSGTLLWSYTTGDRIWSSPAVTDGKIFFGSRDGKVYCLDAFNGSEIWEFLVPPWPRGLSPQDTYVDSSPAVVDGRVYIGTNNRYVYCLDASSGDVIWSYPTGSWVFSSPAVVNNKVYVCSDDGHLYCLDTQNGSLIWSHEAPVFSSDDPTIVDGRVYIVPTNYVLCLDAETGEELWSKTLVPYGELGTAAPGVAEGKLYVGYWPTCELWGIMFCLDAVNGSIVWETNISGNAFGASSPAITDGKVYVGSIGGYPAYHGEVFCFNADTGEILWNFTTGDWIESSPAVAQGRLYVCSNDFTVYCFGNISINHPPTIPTINGPASGKVKHKYNYSIVSTDPEENNISYYVDWGDNTTTGWIGSYPSGYELILNHTWMKQGTYIIKAKAKDVYGNESDWGTITVAMPFSYELPYFQFFEWLVERFPHSFPILRYLLNQ
jgi:outer membrane protein assembly factor BamB